MKSDVDKKILLTFGKRIRELREAKSLSQEELAMIASVHRTYIGMVERGEKNITLLTMCRFANALEITPSQILLELQFG